jgi:hypothetical protein
MVTDKRPRTQEIAKIDESEQVETSERSLVTYLVIASESQQCKDNIKENKKTSRSTTKQPNKTLERDQRGYIIELERQRGYIIELERQRGYIIELERQRGYITELERQRGYITELERKIKDRDNTIAIME